MATAESNVIVNVKHSAVAPKVEAGLSTYMGVILTLIGAVGSVIAALKANDTATVTAGTSAVLVALVTIGGRMAQAVAIAKQVATVAAPIVNAVAALEDPEVEEVHAAELPTDGEEFADAPNDEVPDSAVHPDVPR